jgi:hypothetical protein
MSADDDTDTIILTYQELAARLNIDVPSARRRVLRSRWARSRGNDGRARVAVPISVLARDGADVGSDVPLDDPSDDGRDDGSDVTTDSLIATLQRALDRERTRADRSDERERQLMAEIASLRERLGRAEGEATGLRERAERLQAELEADRAGGPMARAWRAFWRRQ